MQTLKLIFMLLVLTTLYLKAQSGWFWQNPYPQPNELNDIYFVDASRLSSGIYFYQLRSESFVDTKKMVLVK